MTLASFYEPRNDYQFGNAAFDLRDRVAIALARTHMKIIHMHMKKPEAEARGL